MRRSVIAAHSFVILIYNYTISRAVVSLARVGDSQIVVSPGLQPGVGQHSKLRLGEAICDTIKAPD